MKKFDYSFLKDGTVPAKLLNVISSVYSLKTMTQVRKADYGAVFTELEKIAKVQSVKSSNAIEGIVTSDERIRQIVNKTTSPLNHDEQEILGYTDALNKIHLHHKDIDFNEKDILDLHRILLSHTGDEHGGAYKRFDNAIIEIDNSGNRNLRFAPVSALETPKAMEQLVLAFMDARSDPQINKLLLTPCVILDFLCIHPFSDGNGRMSRLLTLLLLYKEGFDVVKYVSFEEQINNYKSYYYDALKRSSAGWHKNENDYFCFVENFMSTLYLCYKELDKRFAVVEGKKVNKSSRVEACVLNSLTPISKSEIHDIFPDISITTIENVLSKLLKQGKVVKLGSTNNARYLRVK